MLVLSRRRGEEIRLPELDITITLVKIKGKAVSLGVSAPEDVRVVRGELRPFDEKPARNSGRMLSATA